MRVTIKKTIACHAARIGLLDGPNIKFSSTEWHKNEIVKRCRYKEKVLKIKKEFVHEQGYYSKCIVVCAVLPQKEKVDSDLIALKFGNGKNLRHISFKESSPDIRLCALHINEMNNVETRFESLLNARVEDRVKFKGKIGTLRDMILSVKNNKVQLFVRVK